MIEEILLAVVGAGAAVAVYAGAAARVVKQYERGVVFRFGRLREGIRGPGFTLVVPGMDRLRKVNMQIVTMPVPAQEGITRDNVTVRVDAVVYFKVVDAAEAIIRVEDYKFAVSQMAQTSLRSIIGKSDLDDLLSNREKLNQGLELMLDSPAIGWGVQIDRVEIKDVSLPETMKRSMARQAEADRERRARVINADAELQASKKLAEAAGVMSEQPAALQLRLLQTVMAVSAEKNSTLVLPIPVELLRFLERATPGDGDDPHPTGGGPARPSGAAPVPQAPSLPPVPPPVPPYPDTPEGKVPDVSDAVEDLAGSPVEPTGREDAAGGAPQEDGPPLERGTPREDEGPREGEVQDPALAEGDPAEGGAPPDAGAARR
ncbi:MULTISPECIES: slipin family protein [unclassified Streptomyces]|uniref:slipin family protein n=1 Tax=unclassified Streptomyces TaxID=2593676 RepID=UPI001660CB30|nr:MULTISPECIES: slipin family protein [unclassified Streptomyces]